MRQYPGGATCVATERARHLACGRSRVAACAVDTARVARRRREPDEPRRGAGRTRRATMLARTSSARYNPGTNRDGSEPRTTWMAETLQDFELAREARLWDGVSLWCGRREQGSVYLLGYHAEMSLKSAYFRFRGDPSTTLIDRSQLNTAAARAGLLGVATPPEAFHSLRFWRDLLVAERLARGLPLPTLVQNELHRHVETLYSRWSVHLRYQAPVSTLADVETVAAAAEWLDAHHQTLHT